MSLDGRPDEERSIRTIHAALDAGVGLIDTADAYARDDRDIGHGERLIAKALKGRRDDVIVATKGGLTRDREQQLAARRAPRVPARGLRGVAARAGDRPHRPLPVPPPRPEGPVRRVDRDVQGAPGRGQGPLGRHLQRHRRPARGGARHRRHRLGAEPALAGLHGTDRQGRGAGVHRARHRLPAVVAARRHRLGGRRGRRRRSGAGRGARRTASRRSRSRWRGCSRSSPTMIPIPARAGRRPSPIRCAPPSSSSATRSFRRSRRRSASPSWCAGPRA